MKLFEDLAEDTTPQEVKPKEPVKTQIVKKIITNPDGTKKVVMVKRVLSSDKDNDIIITPDGKKVRRVIKKIGQPNTVGEKNVVANKPTTEEK